jgi:DNA polymerase-3 subunit alpha (Gram-positive type)
MLNQQRSEIPPIQSLCHNAIRRLYGDTIPKPVNDRLEIELGHIMRNGFVEDYMTAARITDKIRSDGYQTSDHGSMGTSFTAYLLGISEINPLPPHYRCEACKHSEWVDEQTGSGFDLSDKTCRVCGGLLRGDGHYIPYEMFFGVDGRKSPKFHFNVATEYWNSAANSLNTLLGDSASCRLIPNPHAAVMKRLQTLTGMSPDAIPMNDPSVLSLFRSSRALSLQSESWLTGAATCGIPEMNLPWVRRLLQLSAPQTFSDLVQLNGLTHSDWPGVNREQLLSGEATLRSLVVSRDHLYLTLLSYGMDRHQAFSIVEAVRKGKGLSEDHRQAMKRSRIPETLVRTCETAGYLFPKSHAISFTILAFQHMFYKLNYPLEYYTAYYSVHGIRPIYEIVAGGSDAIRHTLASLTPDNFPYPYVFELALEMIARGYRLRKDENAGGSKYAIEGSSRALELSAG